VKPGYKQTEAGVIPEEWDAKRVCEFASVITGGTPRTEVQAYWNGGYPWVTPTDITDQRDMWASERMISESGLSSIRQLPANAVLVTCIASIGKNAILRSVGGCNQQINAVVPKQANSPEFLYYTFESSKQYLLANSGMTATRILSKAAFEQLKFPIPPPPEQRAIATALSDVDGLLGGLDRLIAKKRDLKQAAMQQLLTGQTRLPGFHGEWEVKRLGDLFNFSGGYSASRDQLSAEGHCYLHYGDIHGSTKTCIDADTDFQDIPKLDIPLKRVSSGSLLDDGDVVFVDASEDDAGTSKHVVVVNKDKKPFISGLHTIVAKSKTDELAHEYRRYCFQTPAIRQQFLFYSVGTKVSGISKSNIPKLTLSFPSVPEQTAIAEVLTDMDGELAVLEQRREKTRALKQAMMQELLTGRTRLV
jgi:type I restriction enzyme S subunit